MTQKRLPGRTPLLRWEAAGSQHRKKAKSPVFCCLPLKWSAHDEKSCKIVPFALELRRFLTQNQRPCAQAVLRKNTTPGHSAPQGAGSWPSNFALRSVSFRHKKVPLDTKLSPLDTKSLPLDTKPPPLDTKSPPLDTKSPPLDTKSTHSVTRATGRKRPARSVSVSQFDQGRRL